MATRLESLTERLVTRIEAFLPVEAIGNPRRETQERLDRMPVGQLLQASVIAKLDDGMFIVDLGNAARTRMSLPADTRIGQKLNLSLLSKSPQFSFQVEPEAEAVVTSLSSGARLLENILVDRRDSPTILTGKAPILTTPQLPTAQIGQALRQVIESSGLSYEAHVMQWINGTRPLALLQQEPQQRLYRKNKDAQQSGIRPVPVNPPEAAPSAEAIESPIAGIAAGLATGIAASDPSSPNAELAQLVNAQIDTLEHKRFQWQGEIWPNQTMRWTASEEARHETAQQGSDSNIEHEPKIWQTTLTLDLPGLGPVHARIRLHDETVQIEMEGQAAETVQRLKRQGLHLSERMSSAGLGLTALTIREAIALATTEPASSQTSGVPT